MSNFDISVAEYVRESTNMDITLRINGRPVVCVVK